MTTRPWTKEDAQRAKAALLFDVAHALAAILDGTGAQEDAETLRKQIARAWQPVTMPTAGGEIVTTGPTHPAPEPPPRVQPRAQGRLVYDDGPAPDLRAMMRKAKEGDR